MSSVKLHYIKRLIDSQVQTESVDFDLLNDAFLCFFLFISTVSKIKLSFNPSILLVPGYNQQFKSFAIEKLVEVMWKINRSTRTVSYNIFASCRLVEFMSSTDRKRKKLWPLSLDPVNELKCLGRVIWSRFLFCRLCRFKNCEPSETLKNMTTHCEVLISKFLPAKQIIRQILSLIQDCILHQCETWSHFETHIYITCTVCASHRNYRTRTKLGTKRFPSCITVRFSIRIKMKILIRNCTIITHKVT